MTTSKATSAMFRQDDLVLKQGIDLYDNIASMRNREGRLRVNFQINPFPNLQWDFESLGPQTIEDASDFVGTIIGFDFELNDALGRLSGVVGQPPSIIGTTFSGAALQACIGDRIEYPDEISFYLPNLKCLVETSDGSLYSEQYHIIYEEGNKPPLSEIRPSRFRVGGYWDFDLGSNLGAFISFSDESEKWLNDQQSNGTLLVAKANIINKRVIQENDNQTSLPLNVILKKIDNFCHLISFANGGYIGPLVITLSKYSDLIYDRALFSPYQITPVELLGTTWVGPDSNMRNFISCLPTFERMVETEPWKTTFDLILIWYFQAIQPTSTQLRGKPWPIVANALGAALERLAVMILNEEFKDRTQKGSNRIENLLRKIGVLNSNEDERYAKIFIKVRNNATHPKHIGEYSDEDRRISLQYAKLWVEETLLWRIGYEGKYRRRIPGSNSYSFDEPRYDLRTRLSGW